MSVDAGHELANALYLFVFLWHVLMVFRDWEVIFCKLHSFNAALCGVLMAALSRGGLSRHRQFS